MNQIVKQKWIDALRSGEYTQGQSALNRNDNLCCLGVLCDIHAKETGREWIGGLGSIKKEYLGEVEFLPAQVMNWAGLLSRRGAELYSASWTQRRALPVWNDSFCLSFNQIADLIEAQL